MKNTAKRAMLKREMEYVMAYAMIGETEKNCLRRYADYIGKLI